jgi:hypothetical protein
LQYKILSSLILLLKDKLNGSGSIATKVTSKSYFKELKIFIVVGEYCSQLSGNIKSIFFFKNFIFF